MRHAAPEVNARTLRSSRTCTYFAHPELGETDARVADGADLVEHPRLGPYGAIVVAPEGSRSTGPVTGENVALASRWRVDVRPPSAPSYRSFTLLIQDEDPIIGTAVIPGTPILDAFSGYGVRLHVLVPSGEQTHVFGVEGHRWSIEPGYTGSRLVSAQAIGPLEAITLELVGGAGAPGDYLYGNHREPYREAGLWGTLRVRAVPDESSGLRPLAATVIAPAPP